MDFSSSIRVCDAKRDEYVDCDNFQARFGFPKACEHWAKITNGFALCRKDKAVE